MKFRCAKLTLFRDPKMRNDSPAFQTTMAAIPIPFQRSILKESEEPPES